VAICEDPEVIGAPFYVMEHLDGHVISSVVPEAFDDPSARRALGEELIDALVEIHTIDAVHGPASTLGRPTGYLERQLRRFTSIWEKQRTRELPEMARVQRWLAERRPESSDLCVVHGDYRLGNVMFAGATPARLSAVLDWEMATLGDPLADLGYLCATWAEPDDSDNPMLALSAATRLDGFACRADLIDGYARRTGRDVTGLAWYEVLALWKCAVFLEASYRRYCEKRTDDPYFAALGDGVPLLARAALRRMEED
jgi:aminoglycoside phosphotransferase (APT) family kinase protein